MNDSRIGSSSPLTNQECLQKTHYWEFATHLTISQWRALQYIIGIEESTPDTEVNRILGKYLDKVESTISHTSISLSLMSNSYTVFFSKLTILKCFISFPHNISLIEI